MKITIATGNYPPEVSGQSTFVANLVNALEKLGVPINIVAYGLKLADDENEKISRVKRDHSRHWNYFLTVKKDSRQSQIIYAQDLFSSGLPAALAKTKRQKLIIRLGGDFLWEKMVNDGKSEVALSQYYSTPKSFKQKIYLLIYRFILNRADLIIFNTEWQKKVYQIFFKLNNNKIKVIENPKI